MADFKFPCPDCGQRIQCDDSWCGHKLQCPSCQGDLVVPASSAVALQVLNLFQLSAKAHTRFRQQVNKGTALNWALSEELADSSFAVRSDWKRAPAELLLGFKERLLTCDALRAEKVIVEIGDDGDDEALQLAISAGDKAAKSYHWDGTGKPGFHDLVFSFAHLLPPEIGIYSLKAFEETDTVAYVIGPGTLWKTVRELLSDCFDQLFASHSPEHKFEPVQAKKRKSRAPDWRKLWNEYAGPASHGTAEDISKSLDILRPMSPDDLFYGKDKMLRTNGISFFLHELDGKPLDAWRIDRNSSRLATILYVYASAARVGALWNIYALNTFPERKLSGHCLGRGYLIWAYFILRAMKAEQGAQECGRLLELETVRKKERSDLNRTQISHYDLALYLHNGSQSDELNALEPMFPMLEQESWRDPEKVKAAVKAHAQTRGEQFVHDSIKWTWPATLYALARRADALDLLPRDNPFLDTPLDVSKVDRSDPWLEEFRVLESRFRDLNFPL